MISAAFHFYGNKIITTGEGGIILTNSLKLKNKMYKLKKNHGRSKREIFKHNSIGYNFMFTDLQAAIGNVQLDKLEKILKKKSMIYKNYRNQLSNIKEISFIEALSKNTPVHWFKYFSWDKKKLQNI